MRAVDHSRALPLPSSPFAARSRWLGRIALVASSALLAPLVGGLPWWGSAFLMSPSGGDWVYALAAVYMMAFVPAIAGGVLFAWLLPCLMEGRFGFTLKRTPAQGLAGLLSGLLGGVVCALFFAVEAPFAAILWCAFVGLLLGLVFPSRVARAMHLTNLD